MKICALLVPREMKLEHSGGVKAMTDEQLERSIELLKEAIAKRDAAANAKLIDGEPVDAAALPAPDTRAGGPSVPPKVLEPVGRMLDVPVAEVVLQGPRVVAIVGELEPTGMAQHVWVDRERHLGSLADALDEAVEANRTDWPAALGNEYVGVFGVVTP